MIKPKDLTGQKFGKLTVLSKGPSDKFKKTRWYCQCECGNTKLINASSLLRGLTISCGCNSYEKRQEYNKSKIVDETGNVYGYLTVIKQNDKIKHSDGRALWDCKCKCGNIITVPGRSLRNGHTTSCGCRRQSLGEETVEKLLLQNNFNYAKEYLVAARKEQIKQYHKSRFDFAIFDNNNNLKYLIEYDGSQHFEENVRENGLGFNTREAYEKTHKRDMIKNQWCKDNNIPLIRIPYTHLDKLTIEDLKLETTTFLVK